MFRKYEKIHRLVYMEYLENNGYLILQKDSSANT